MPTREQDTTHGEIDALAWQRLRQLADDLKNQNIDSVAKLLTLRQEEKKERIGVRQLWLSIATAAVSVLTLGFSVWNNINTSQLLKRTSTEAAEKAKREEMKSALDSLATNEEKIFGGTLTPDDWKAIFEVLKEPDKNRALLVQAFDQIANRRTQARTGSDNDEQASAKNVAVAAVATQQSSESRTGSSRVLSGVLIFPQCAPSLVKGDQKILNDEIQRLGGTAQPWQSVSTIDSTTTVRYYHPAEKQAAEALLKIVQAVFPDAGAEIRSLENTTLANKVRQPMIEIWIGTAAGEAHAQ